MKIEIDPIINEPALVIENSEIALVLADIHLGIEWDLYRSGISIPSGMEQRLERIISYIEESDPDRIVLLGDIKHNVPRISWQERDEMPDFLQTLSKYASVDIIPGNHDVGIDFLLPKAMGIKVHSQKGAVIDGVGYFHGHTWPDHEILGCEYIITAHNHPTIRFTDPLGYSTSEPAWIRTRLNRDVLSDHYKSLELEEIWKDPQVLIVPAFNELCGGVPFNESTYEDLLGPVFSAKGIELDSSRAYLLDGTDLGELKNIRELDQTRKRSRPRKSSRTKK